MGIFSKDKKKETEDSNATNTEVKRVSLSEFGLLKQKFKLSETDIHKIKIIEVAKELQRYAKARL